MVSKVNSQGSRVPSLVCRHHKGRQRATGRREPEVQLPGARATFWSSLQHSSPHNTKSIVFCRLFFLKFLFMCMWTYLCMPHVFRYLQRPEGVRFLTVGVTSGCRHPMSVLEIKLRFFGSMGGTEVPVLTDDKH